MTPSAGSDGSLPPSYAANSGGPSRRRRRTEDSDGTWPAAVPPPGRDDGAQPLPPSHPVAHSPAPAPGGGASRRRSPAPGSRTPGDRARRGAGGPARPAHGASRAREGSSAVPLGQDPAPEPAERTQVMPVGAVRPHQAAEHPPPGAAYGSPAPETAPPPVRPGEAGPEVRPARPGRRRRRFRPLRWVAIVLVLLIALIAGRVAWLVHDVNSKLQRVDALSGAADTPGQTWLIVGSDARGDGGVADDGTEGARADSIMLLHRAENGQASLTSLPRDTYVEIPGYGGDKINSAYSYEGPALLVLTVESLTGLTVDHYVEVGMGGVSQMVDAVDGVNVCLDYDVDDADSGLQWDTSEGTCQDVDGQRALAYSRMRKSDPTGDIGRGLRQRAVINAVVDKAASWQTVVNFPRQDALVDAGTQAFTVDRDTNSVDLAQMVLAFRAASSSGLTGAPPIESLDYEPGWVGSAVLLQDTTAPSFFAALRDGELTVNDFNQGP